MYNMKKAVEFMTNGVKNATIISGDNEVRVHTLTDEELKEVYGSTDIHDIHFGIIEHLMKVGHGKVSYCVTEYDNDGNDIDIDVIIKKIENKGWKVKYNYDYLWDSKMRQGRMMTKFDNGKVVDSTNWFGYHLTINC